MNISRTLIRAAAGTAGVGLALGLAAGPAGADVGAPTEPVTTAKISLTNAVITGVTPVVQATANTYAGLTQVRDGGAVTVAESLTISGSGLVPTAVLPSDQISINYAKIKIDY